MVVVAAQLSLMLEEDLVEVMVLMEIIQLMLVEMLVSTVAVAAVARQMEPLMDVVEMVVKVL